MGRRAGRNRQASQAAERIGGPIKHQASSIIIINHHHHHHQTRSGRAIRVCIVSAGSAHNSVSSKSCREAVVFDLLSVSTRACRWNTGGPRGVTVSESIRGAPPPALALQSVCRLSKCQSNQREKVEQEPRLGVNRLTPTVL